VATPSLIPFGAFAKRFRIPLFDWQREAFGTATAREGDHFRYRLAGVSVPRGNGKSWGSAAVGLWLLISRPDQDIISSALDLEGARVVLQHARTMVRSHPTLAEHIEVLTNELRYEPNGSRWTITSREHTASRGRHPTLVLYDEAGWARDDELFASLLAGQASVADPLMLVTSTVGRRKIGPLWTLKTLAEGADESVFWYWRTENLSPKVTPAFLERQRRILLPAQFAREHQNTWVDAADSFTSATDVDAAMAHSWLEQIQGDVTHTYVMFVDLGAVHDPTVIAVGHEHQGNIYLDRLTTFQGSRETPVQLKTVEATIVDLASKFSLTTIRIESWQGLAASQSLAALGLPVELFTPTAKAHAEEWPLLAQALTARRLVLFPHARLREELLNLVYAVGPTGVKVSDRGKIHQDHAVAVRGVVASLAGPLDTSDWTPLLSAGQRRNELTVEEAANPAADDLFEPSWDVEDVFDAHSKVIF
jgi:phage terminase large subunit-like protein